MRTANKAQKEILTRDWTAGVRSSVIIQRLNAVEGGRHYENSKQLQHSAQCMELKRVLPVHAAFPPERDAVIRDLYPTRMAISEIHRLVLEKPGTPDVTSRAIRRRATYLKIYRPAGYVDKEALQRNGRSAENLARLAAVRKPHAPQAPKKIKPAKVAATVLPKPISAPVVREPAPSLSKDRGFVRMHFGQIKAIAARDGFWLDSPHDLGKYNAARERLKRPALYLPLTSSGRAMA